MPKGNFDNHPKAAKCYRWNKQKMISPQGYVKVRVGKKHPIADPNGYCYEHKLILQAAGIHLSPGMVAHHINGDKADNRLENLCVMSRAEHNKHHNKEKDRDQEGRIISRTGRLLDRREHLAVPV